ncbi:MAG: family 16 glycoside hydrolase [Planctomycetota bacterium]
MLAALRRFPIALALLALALPLHAQTQDEAMREMMKAMTPGPQHAEIARGAGRWSLERTITMPGVQLFTSTGESVGKMVLDGRFLEVETRGEMMGMSESSKVLVGYDNTRALYTVVAMSTNSTGMMMATGKKLEDGSYLYEGTIYEYPTPGGRPFRHTHRWVNDDTQVMEVFDRIDDAWVKVVTQTMRRKRALFDGKSLAGWSRVALNDGDDMSKTWSVDHGILRCQGSPAGYIRTDGEYADYELELEWRWAPGSRGGNSGLLVHTSNPNQLWGWPKCLEVQLQANNAGDFWEIGESAVVDDLEARRKGRNIKRVAREDVERPIGEWNLMKVRCEGDRVRVWVNGELVNDGREVSAKKGAICLQSEGAEIHFRRVELTPLR